MVDKREHTILIVDDDKATRKLLSAILKDYSIVSAENGREALALARDPANPPDLILLDIVMPEMSGKEVCEQLKSDKTQKIPIIFLTGKRDPKVEAECLRLKAEDFITKPINAPVLKARVDTQLNLKLHREHLEQLVRERTQEIEDTQKEVIWTLSELMENRSPETAQHVMRVSMCVELLARKAKLDEPQIKLLKFASPMHDIGKIAIPDHILNKPGKLTDDEYEKMKKHTTIGHKILEKSNRDIFKTAAIIAYQHHERWDGNGYPQRLKGKRICLYARITAIVDTFDVMYQGRPYRKARPIDDIIKEFEKETGKQFDPELTDLFLTNLHEFESILRQNPDEPENNEK